MKKSVILASSMALLAVPALVQAQGTIETDVRSADQVRIDLNISQENKVIEYTIQKGDNLEALAEVFRVEESALEQVSDFAAENELDILKEGAVYKLEHDQTDQDDALDITVDGEVVEFNLETKTVKVKEKLYYIEENNQADQVVHIIDEVAEFVPETTVQATEDSQVKETLVESEPVEEAEPVEVTEEVEAVENGEVAPAAQNILATVQEFVDSVDEYAISVQEKENEVYSGETVAEEATEAATPTEEATPAATPAEEVVETTTQEAEAVVPTESTPVEEAPVEEASAPAEQGEVYQANEDFQVEYGPANGLQDHVARERDYYGAKYDVTVGGYRPGDPGDHGSGLALDFMVYDDTAKGYAIANDFTSRIDSGDQSLSYVIWQQQIYGDWNKTWEAMEDRGSDTQNHKDHVHVSYR